MLINSFGVGKLSNPVKNVQLLNYIFLCPINQMNIIDFFVFLLSFIILITYIFRYYSEISYVKSNVDNRTYLVRQLGDKEKAANLLAEVSKDLQKLVNHLVAKYPDNESIKRLFKNFNPDNISEGSPDSGYTSYSVNKGENIVLCIRQNDNNKTLVDKNTILYVSIHELAHLMTKSIGHDSVFWNNFKFILKEAVDIGIYKKIDYKINHQSYCGIEITNNIL